MFDLFILGEIILHSYCEIKAETSFDWLSTDHMIVLMIGWHGTVTTDNVILLQQDSIKQYY